MWYLDKLIIYRSGHLFARKQILFAVANIYLHANKRNAGLSSIENRFSRLLSL